MVNHRVRTVVGSATTGFLFDAAGERVSEWNAATHAQLNGNYYWQGKSQAMKKYCLLTVLLFSFISGCAKPDHVTTIKSPTEGVFYTVETFNGHGAADSDFTRVYAHLERNGKSDKKLVVDGGYLEISKIIWTGPHDVTLCKQAGGWPGCLAFGHPGLMYHPG
jgi:hypothetical protein